MPALMLASVRSMLGLVPIGAIFTKMENRPCALPWFPIFDRNKSSFLNPILGKNNAFYSPEAVPTVAAKQRTHADFSSN